MSSIRVRVLADSLGDHGVRLTTLECRYPRIIHCFDDQTEVLSRKEGLHRYRPWPEVANDPDVELAAFDPEDRSIRFERPSAWVVEEVRDEEMVSVENQRISMLVTKGHRLYVGSRKKHDDHWEIVTADHLLGEHTQKRFETSGHFQSDDDMNPALAALLGFFVGDGGLCNSKAVFHLKKQRKIEYLHQLLRTLGWEFTFTQYADGTTNTRVPLRVLPEQRLFEFCYAGDEQKKIPERVFRANFEAAHAFLEGLWNADGSTDKGPLVVFNTTSPHVADQLNVLASMHDLRINLTEPYDYKEGARPVYKLQRATEDKPILRRDKHPAQVVRYTGKVYCATVSTGLLMVRRQGKVHVSGNSEVMTHRAFSRNAASSRAIPTKKMLKNIIADPFFPLHWGKREKGMQAYEEIPMAHRAEADQLWFLHLEETAELVRYFAEDLRIAKQITNRPLEWAMWYTAVISATDFMNFLSLRAHHMAEPHIQALAWHLFRALGDSEPAHLDAGDWHLPLIFPKDRREVEDIGTLKKISTGRCARVSYLSHDGERSHEADIALHDRLAVPGETQDPMHASAFEHVAQCLTDSTPQPDLCGNFWRGWKQYRKEFPNERALEMPELDLNDAPPWAFPDRVLCGTCGKATPKVGCTCFERSEG